MPTQVVPWTNGRVRYATSTPAGGGTTDPVWVDWEGRRPLSVAVFPQGGTARVEYTLDDRQAVDGGSALWVPWQEGDVTQATANAIEGPVTALRMVSSAAADLRVLG